MPWCKNDTDALRKLPIDEGSENAEAFTLFAVRVVESELKLRQISASAYAAVPGLFAKK
jgi:hypothetical protein